MQKAIIGMALGVLGLGGLVLAGSSSRTATTPGVPSSAVVGSEQTGSTVVDCGDGRQALVHPAANGVSRVECVPMEAAAPPVAAMSYASGFAPAVPAVQERIVYRDRPVARTTTRRTAASATSATSSAASPVYREPQRRTRSWKKSAVVIGGATAGGAGVGAVLGGGSGAKKGAVVGLVGGTIYDIATRNK
jgi:hypothetical protein